MEKFAKVVELDKGGQLLLMKDLDEDSNLQLVFKIMINGAFLAMSVGYESLEELEDYFNSFDNIQAEKISLGLLNIIK